MSKQIDAMLHYLIVGIVAFLILKGLGINDTIQSPFVVGAVIVSAISSVLNN